MIFLKKKPRKPAVLYEVICFIFSSSDLDRAELEKKKSPKIWNGYKKSRHPVKMPGF